MLAIVVQSASCMLVEYSLADFICNRFGQPGNESLCSVLQETLKTRCICIMAKKDVLHPGKLLWRFSFLSFFCLSLYFYLFHWELFLSHPGHNLFMDYDNIASAIFKCGITVQYHLTTSENSSSPEDGSWSSCPRLFFEGMFPKEEEVNLCKQRFSARLRLCMQKIWFSCGLKTIFGYICQNYRRQTNHWKTRLRTTGQQSLLFST